MKLTRKNYPFIFKGFDDIVSDNVASSIITRQIKKKLDKGFQTRHNKADVIVAERFISSLTDEQREIITMGDQDEAKELFGKKKGYQVANKIFGNFFENMR